MVIQLFESLGVDVRRAAEVFGICCEDKTEFSYGGFYHIVGKIESQKESLYFQVSEKVWKQNPEMVVSVTDKFSIWFTEECSLVPDRFPEQRLQMEISFDIQWVLERPYWEVDMSPRQWKRIQEALAKLVGVSCFSVLLTVNPGELYIARRDGKTAKQPCNTTKGSLSVNI